MGDGLLDLLPEGAEAKLREIGCFDYVIDGRHEVVVEHIAKSVLDTSGAAFFDDADRENTAYLLVLLIDRERRVAALEAGLRPFAGLADDWEGPVVPQVPVRTEHLRAARSLLATPGAGETP